MKYVDASRRVFLETGTRFPREMIWAVAAIKYAAAGANVELGLLDNGMGQVIQRKAKELMDGQHDEKVTVDVFQTGSGTGLNMNANELIAELATEALGKKVHPNDHVNMSQSSNDVGPTTVRIAGATAVHSSLNPSFQVMTRSLRSLSKKTATVYKSGRTHLRDALPVTMGQEFGAFADAFTNDSEMIAGAADGVLALPIGGTAVGTGLNADPEFGRMVTKTIAELTGLGFRPAKDKFRATKMLTDVVALSGAMKAASIDLYKLCQDMRLMYSGPITGIDEIDIPTQEEVAGSSIMPGKTNPVTLESAMLACAQVLGLDAANTFAGSLGEFELTMGVPLIGYNIVLQAKLLAEAMSKVSAVAVDGVVPNKERARKFAESSPSLITVISPKIGYDRAAVVGKKLAHGASIRTALAELGYSKKEVDAMLDLGKLVRPGIPSKTLGKTSGRAANA